ncbi:uncharacterized protein Z520_12054 [Fonsecaea multimorphosa CBS 102226]|uniref:Uncharacterized protein n=1 Tax=Fonsecaea multimorphosa CBS 102226 TaxID=1442371 RepID=A0A0D2K7I1_9EURO|nr:uncharacterized protein Z520_12054 [Fonsecaea multimorphosa CBS 102226]KIX92308.1 hypothetical protein Z520_12054 [Fonsecaea multimorphosa CBS 102226]OAL17678.1 hypothetical protein AYO22_11468 [Fonsecaea multimorphosa]
MTPNIAKGQTDTSKFTGQGPESKEAHPHNNPVMEYNPAPGAKAGTLTTQFRSLQAPMLSSDGSVGKQFTADGAIGGTAQKIGGPLDQNGMIGGMFKEDGAIGGTVNKMAGGKS